MGGLGFRMHQALPMNVDVESSSDHAVNRERSSWLAREPTQLIVFDLSANADSPLSYAVVWRLCLATLFGDVADCFAVLAFLLGLYPGSSFLEGCDPDVVVVLQEAKQFFVVFSADRQVIATHPVEHEDHPTVLFACCGHLA
ncbi:hypothetical protein Pla22_32990 [Rubripirellula amarantea]|uniref:Uncharacterized protein n=1 Tax=Rubripirellula amarantea TaxID=2527999 RepID=A0A5C5WIC2_9BACT|nr:hypothetical protein Pla22_32990 [Rubripirellula amarantea]